MADGRLHVVGIGSMAVDRVHRAPRILGAGEKGILREMEGGGPVRLYVGGVVLNHLGWAAVLGLRVGIFGRQPDDEGGRFLRAAMARAGIETDIALEGSATTVAEIFVDDSGERSIYMAPGATLETTGEHVRRVHADFIRRASILSTEISQLPLEATLAALEVARAAGLRTVVDFDVPASDAIATLGDEASLTRVLEAADVLKPAKLAARELFPNLAADPLALAQAIRERFGNDAVVVTDGEAGCAIATEAYRGTVSAHPAKSIDSTGAGDAFLGGLLVAMHHRLPWEAAGRLANACGAACVEQMGAFPEDADAARARVLGLYTGPAFEPPEASERGAAPKTRGAPGAAEGLAVLVTSVEELQALAARTAADEGVALVRAADLIEEAERQGGRVHVTGLGKPEHVSKYGAALLSSCGTPATFLHATEAVHGSLGQLRPGDVLIAISNTGATRELVRVAELARKLGVRVVAVTGNPASALAACADVVLDARVGREGGPLGLAPRASVAAEVLVIAALSATLQQRAGFTREDYAARHPDGALGEKARG